MPRLENARHEAFARAVVEGKSATAAYIAAGYRAANADANASRLMGNDGVAGRIAELKEHAADHSVATARQVLQEPTKIALANLGPNCEMQEISNFSRDKAAALAEITVETFLDGHGEGAREVRRVKFKLADKLTALAHLCRYYRLFSDKTKRGDAPMEGRIAIEFVKPLKKGRRTE
jgi:phage terminase small subunit